MKLCIALDLPTMGENLFLAKQLEGRDVAFKVGFKAFLDGGHQSVTRLKEMGFEVCLDLKLYDIPNTMAEAAKTIAGFGVDMFTIHASAGRSAMEAVASAVDTCFHRPKILAVTVLTSFSNDECYEIYEGDVADKAEYFAVQARRAGMDGIVCSVHECEFLREMVSGILFVPGIRLNDTPDDQARKGSLEVASKVGADYAVMGRPIYMDENPLIKADWALREIARLNDEL
jgi:orotidine-5'-phosphate decarboxylase